MKHTIFLLFALVAVSCSDDDVTYSVTPELSTYVDSFYTEAQLRGKLLPKDNLIVSLDQSQSVTEVKRDGEQWIISFDKEMFEQFQASGSNKIESFLFHELGRVVLKRELSTGQSIMNGNVKVNGFSNADRSALLDELFQ